MCHILEVKRGFNLLILLATKKGKTFIIVEEIVEYHAIFDAATIDPTVEGPTVSPSHVTNIHLMQTMLCSVRYPILLAHPRFKLLPAGHISLLLSLVRFSDLMLINMFKTC